MLGVSTSGDSSHCDLGLALKNLPNSLNLGVEAPPLIGGKPCERLHSHLNSPARATVVPNAGDHAVHEQNRKIAGLPGWCESARGCLAGKEPGSRLAADDVGVKVGQQHDACG